MAPPSVVPRDARASFIGPEGRITEGSMEMQPWGVVVLEWEEK